MHPKVDSDLDSLPSKVQDAFHDRVELLRTGERHSSTHPLNGPLKGWSGTKLSGQHRMVHKYEGGDLMVLSAANHDEAYDQAFRRAKTASLDEVAKRGYCTEGWNRWQQGECGTYAHALITGHPHLGLQLGVSGETDNGGGDASDGWRPKHFYAHDEHHAYDSAGKHKLPYLGIHKGDMDYSELGHETEDWGLPEEEGHGNHDQRVKDALDHAHRNGILEGRYGEHPHKEAMGQAGPDYDNLTFHHGEHPLYPADNDFKTLFAHHPEHGDVGRLTYRVMDHPAWTGWESPTAHVTMMHVDPEHQRRGVASQLMDHFEHHVMKDVLVDHGHREPEGQEWAKSKYNDPSNMDGFEKSRTTKNGRPWNIETGKPYRMPKKQAADWNEYQRVKDSQQRRYETAGNGGSKDDRDAYFGLGEHGPGQEELITPQKWIEHSRTQRITDLPASEHAHLSGWELGRQHAQQGKINPDEVDREHARHQHSEHFLRGYSEGLDEGFGKSALKLGHFTPHLRVFTHTCGLDHRLWGADEKLKPEVRSYILQSIAAMWGEKFPTWSHWARVYFAGSEASEWTSEALEGNNDFDVLIGVDYAHLRDSLPQYRGVTNEQITDLMNQGFRAYNGPIMLTVDGTQYGPFDRTSYVNPDSYDIRAIKPYAAYDVGKNEWVVKPPHLPHWGLDKLPEATRKVLRAADTLARTTLKLAEPERTQQGAALFDAWHSDRSRAFGPNGEGWWDIANLREKWLDQAGLWAQIVDCKHRFTQGLGAAAPDWSNDPKTAGAGGEDYKGLSFRYFKNYSTEHDHPQWLDGNDKHDRRSFYGAMAFHPDHPHSVGTVEFSPIHYGEGDQEVHIHGVKVNPEHQRRGVGTALLNHVEHLYPDTPIYHGLRTQQGADLAQHVYGHPSEKAANPGSSHQYGDAPYEGGWTKGGLPWHPKTGAANLDRNAPLKADIEFKPGSHYRMIGEQGFHDFLDTGKIRAAQDTKADYQHPYFNQDHALERYRNRRAQHDYIAEAHDPGLFHTQAEGAFPTPKRELGPGDVSIHRVHVPTGRTETVHTPTNPHPAFRSPDDRIVGMGMQRFASPDELFEDEPDFWRMWNRPPVKEKKTAAWNDYGDLPEGRKPRPKSVRRAGFAGFTADSRWDREFGVKKDHPNEIPDHIDDHLSHFSRDHGEHMGTWKDKGTYGVVDLSQGVHATQTHVSQFHIDRYKKTPHDTAWFHHPDNGDGPLDDDSDENNTERSASPMFVTHHGRLHAIDGHHRVASILQDGGKQAVGWHYDLDKHPIVKVNGNDCPECARHAAQSHAETQRSASVSTDYPLRSQALTRAHRLFGRGLDALFPHDEDGPKPSTSVPFPQARQSKDRRSYDSDLVARSITHPHEFPIEKVDPRELHATQPSVTRDGVKHYMEGGRDYGAQNGGDHRLGNDIPRIYHRLDDDHKFLLSGHHRATSALLKGEPMDAIVVRGGWGPERK